MSTGQSLPYKTKFTWFKLTCCRQTWDSAEVHPYLLLRPKKH